MKGNTVIEFHCINFLAAMKATGHLASTSTGICTCTYYESDVYTLVIGDRRTVEL